MECFECLRPFNRTNNEPKILPFCGHTICKACLQERLKGRYFECPECRSKSTCESISSFPTNYALLNTLETRDTNGTRELRCPKHSKKIEAYCEKDCGLICVDCLITKEHQNHHIIKLEQAIESVTDMHKLEILDAKKYSEKLKEKIDQLNSQERELNMNRDRAEVKIKEFAKLFRSVIEEDAGERLAKVSDTYIKQFQNLQNKKSAISGTARLEKSVQEKRDTEYLLTNVLVRKKLLDEMQAVCDADIPGLVNHFEIDFENLVDSVSQQMKNLFKESFQIDSSKSNQKLPVVSKHRRDKSISRTLTGIIKEGEKRGVKDRSKTPGGKRRRKGGKTSKKTSLARTPTTGKLGREGSPKLTQEAADKREDFESCPMDRLQRRRNKRKSATPTGGRTPLTIQNKEETFVIDAPLNQKPFDKNFAINYLKGQTISIFQESLAISNSNKKSQLELSKTNARLKEIDVNSCRRLFQDPNTVQQTSPSNDSKKRELSPWTRRKQACLAGCDDDYENHSESENTPIKSSGTLELVRVEVLRNRKRLSQSPNGSHSRSFRNARSPDNRLDSSKCKISVYRTSKLEERSRDSVINKYESETLNYSSLRRAIIDSVKKSNSSNLSHEESVIIKREQTKPSNKGVYAIGGVSFQSGLAIERWTPSSNEWTIVDNQNEARAKFGSLYLEPDQLIIFGGKQGDAFKADFQCYDLESNNWRSMSISLTEPKCGFGYFQKNHKLYIAGGRVDPGKVTNSFEEYDLYTGKNRKLQPMIIAREEFSLINLNDELYAIGGGNSNGKILRSVERFDFNLGKWELSPDMLIPRRAHTCISAHQRIYSIGGYDGDKYLCSMERYDLQTGLWSQLKFMNSPRCMHSALYLEDDDSIIIFGGFNGKTTNSSEKYNIKQNAWRSLDSLKIPRFMHSGIIVP